MYAKHGRKGHDEQDLAATSRNIFFFCWGNRNKHKRVKLQTEDNSWAPYKRGPYQYMMIVGLMV